MPESNGGSHPLVGFAWLLAACLLSATSALSQNVRAIDTERKMNSIQQQLEAVEQRFTSVRIEIMKLRADADYIESAISEEMHLMQALRGDDEITPPASKDMKPANSLGPPATAADAPVETHSPPGALPAAPNLPPDPVHTQSIAAGQPAPLSQPSEGPSISPPLPANQAQPPASLVKKEEFVFVERRVNVRAAPSLQGRILGPATPGTRFVVLSRMVGWVEVEREGSSAWIADRFLTTEAPAAPDATVQADSAPSTSLAARDLPPAHTPAIAAGQPAIQLPPDQSRLGSRPHTADQSRLAKKQEFVFVQRRVNVRAAPSLRGRILGPATPGTHFLVLSRSPGWVQVQQGNSNAWVDDRFVSTSRPTPNAAAESTSSIENRSAATPSGNFFFR